MTSIIFDQGAAGTESWPVAMGQVVDGNNTKFIQAADAQPGNPWIGTATATRSQGVVGMILSVIAPGQAIGGTYTFEFGEDGATWPISIGLHANDFSTIRFRQLLNVGAYYRAKFEPDAPLGAGFVVLTTQLARQDDPDFVVPAGHVFEEDEAAFGAGFAFLKGFNARTRHSGNVRIDDTEALRVVDDRLAISQSGAIRVTGIRDDISVAFFDGTHVGESRGILDDGSVNGTVTHDPVEGRAVFSVPATAGSKAVFRSEKLAVYEPAHTIRGEQTIEVSALPIGNGFVEWGFGDGSNSIGWRLDAGGLFVIRRKNGTLLDKVARADWNRDVCDGMGSSQFVFNYTPQALDPLKNNRYAQEYEWLGVAPTDFYVVAPNKKQVNVHVIEYPNQSAGTTVPNPQLPMYVHVQNDTVTPQALSAACGSWRGGTLTNNTVSYGQQPDGDYVAAKSDGTVFENETPLVASGSFTSEWFDSDGWATLELFVATDQVSAGQGIEIQYTNDVNVVTPIVRGTEKFTFTAADVARGFLALNRVVRLDGFRIKYTNGGVNQGAFFITGTVRVSPAGPPLNSLESEIDSTSIAQMARTAIFAKDGGAYTLIGRGTAGGLDMGVVQHEVATPVKSLTGIKFTRTVVTTTAGLIVGTDLTNRRAITIKCDATNSASRIIDLGTTNAVTSGAGYELTAGESLNIDLQAGVGIYAITNTGTGTLSIIEGSATNTSDSP